MHKNFSLQTLLFPEIWAVKIKKTRSQKHAVLRQHAIYVSVSVVCTVCVGKLNSWGNETAWELLFDIQELRKCVRTKKSAFAPAFGASKNFGFSWKYLGKKAEKAENPVVEKVFKNFQLLQTPTCDELIRNNFSRFVPIC